MGEGGYGLSGGQAQRVAIARAFLKNAPLLLLDEPTAHLDPATEAEVLDSLRRLALGRTVILASHSSAAHGFAGRRLDIRDGRAVAGAWRGMNDVLRILGLWRGRAVWLAAGIVVSLAALLAGVGMMAIAAARWCPGGRGRRAGGADGAARTRLGARGAALCRALGDA